MIYSILFIFLLIIAIVCAWQISVTDWRKRIIPDIYLFPLMLIGLIVTHFFPWPVGPGDAIISAAFGYFLATVIGFIFRLSWCKHAKKEHDPMGLGDVKLISVGGLWLGTTGLAITLVISCIAGILWGTRKKQRFIPFAPFFIVSGILTLISMIFLI